VLFNSIGFIILLPICTLLYYLLPARFRVWYFLLISYLYFITIEPRYLTLLLAATLVNFISGIWISSTTSITQKKLVFILGLIVNIGILSTFKYFAFLNESVKFLVESFGIEYTIPSYNFIIPVGISFFTLQNLSYLFDVYRGSLKAERNLLKFALYTAFFTKITAGPIERAGKFLPQINQPHSFDYAKVTHGLKRFTWGLFKKMVVADRIVFLIAPIFNDPGDFHGFTLILSVYFFAIQVYLDFSAYSDIAIGLAEMFGFTLTENFRRPYFAASIIEFWNRWHISLSTWLRDYIFYPLRRGLIRQKSARMIQVIVPPIVTMLVSGLWHGAGWTFVIWGLLHGLYFTIAGPLEHGIDQLVKWLRLDRYPAVSKGIKIFVTFNLVSFAWIFFRANSLTDALTIIHNITLVDFRNTLEIFIDRPARLAALQYSTIFFIVVLIIEILEEKHDLYAILKHQPTWLRWLVYYAVVMSITLFSADPNMPLQFMYYQF
jgi:alginate O-acetyltransferase complex protein AlgI